MGVNTAFGKHWSLIDLTCDDFGWSGKSFL